MEPSMNRCRTTTTRARKTEDGGESNPLPKRWWLAERVFDWAATHGMTPASVEAQVDELVAYWSDRGQRAQELGRHVYPTPAAPAGQRSEGPAP